MRSFELIMWKVLDVSSNLFEGPLPTLINTDSSSLRYVNFSRNRVRRHHRCASHSSQFQDLFPIDYYSFTGLTVFDLSHNQMLGGLAAPIGISSNLNVLKLDHNQFSGKISDRVSFKWRKSGEIPHEMGSLTQLTTLTLNDNRLMAESLNFLSQMTSLQMVDLSRNSISATLPTQLGELHSKIFLIVDSFEHRRIVGIW